MLKRTIIKLQSNLMHFGVTSYLNLYEETGGIDSINVVNLQYCTLPKIKKQPMMCMTLKPQMKM